MIKKELRDFIDRVVEVKKISHEDVRLLQRNILDDGLTSKEEAEALLALDRSLPSDALWPDVLAMLFVDFVVWGLRPTGRVAKADAVWLADALELGGSHGSAMHIVDAIAAEVQETDGAVIDVVRHCLKFREASLAA